MGCGLGSSIWPQPLEAPTLESVSVVEMCPYQECPPVPVPQSPNTQLIQDPTPVCGHQCVSLGGRTSRRRGH